MGSLTPLVDSGADAYSNLFDVNITLPSVIASTASALNYSVRISDFKPPEFKQSTYKTEYKGVSITKLGPKIEGERVFEIPYRIDSNYQFHLDMMKWKHIYMDPSGDGAINYDIPYSTDDGTTNFGEVVVSAYNPSRTASTDTTSSIPDSPGDERVAEAWSFFHVACVEAGVPTFNRESGDPNKAVARFVFIRMVEPGQKTPLAVGTNDPALTS